MNECKSPVCEVAGCPAPARGPHGLCNKHRLRMQRHGRLELPIPQRELPCTVDGCDRLRTSSRGLCSKHLYRWEKYGSTEIAAWHVEKHGMADHPLYSTWMNMRRRCESPYATAYAFYGGRGIRVCDRWRTSFSAFVADVGERPNGATLDRIDGDGDYEPGNVRWALPTTQSKNQKLRADNTSGHKGVSWRADRACWRAYVGGGDTRVELGVFDTLSEAIEARHQATVNDADIHCCGQMEELRKSHS